MNIIIRNVEEKDIPAVVDIQIEGWKSAYKEIIDEEVLNSMNREQKIIKMKKNFNERKCVVAEINNQVVGFCRYFNEVMSPDGENFDCEIMALYVKPELKHQGIGKTMVNYIKKEFKKNGKTKMILWCLKENYSSRKFYEKMGGTIVGEHCIEIGGKLYPEVGFGYEL